MGKGYTLIDYKGKIIQKFTLPHLHYTITGHSEMGQFAKLAQAKAAVDKMEKRAKTSTSKRARNLGWWVKSPRRR